MERSLLKLVNQANMAARLNTKYVKPMYFPNFYGTKKVSTLTWQTLVGEQGAPVVTALRPGCRGAPCGRPGSYAG